MSKQAKLSNISSKILLQKIFDYINDYDYKLKYKLFVHSKHFQNLLGLDIVDYEIQYINKFDMKLYDFLIKRYDYNSRSFNKNELNEIFDQKLKENNLDEKLIRKIIVDYFIKIGKKYEEKENANSGYFIDIFLNHKNI